MRLNLIAICFSLLILQGCISASVDKIDADPGFNWDTLMRDIIVMTPLMDLRGKSEAPYGFEKDVDPFTHEQEIAFAEAFKQVFFKYRKDIRVFGAGGAFENIAKIPNLTEIAKKVLNKEPLPVDDVQNLEDARQDKRFIFFFYFTNERLFFDYGVEVPIEAKGLYVRKIYTATRTMTLKLALWDSKERRTVFISEKDLSPQFRNEFLIRTGLRPQRVKGDKGSYASAIDPDVYDRLGTSGLEQEYRVHRKRFPSGFPKREPSFSGSFVDLALSLPIKGSEQNKIEYDYFSNHRFELTMRNSNLGSKSMSDIFLGMSSIRYNLFRLGFGLEFSASKPKVTHNSKEYTVDNLCLCMTTDLEWELHDHLRMMTGAMLGAGSFGIKRPATPGIENLEPKYNESDGYWYAAPRLKFILGAKQGGQLGLGVYHQFYSGLVEAPITENPPGPWGVELTLAVTVRGF